MNKVLIYTKNSCPYCVRAKNFLNNKNIPFDERYITDVDEMLKIKKETGWATFPIIFVGDQLIGGFDDMNALDQRGEFEPLLKR